MSSDYAGGLNYALLKRFFDADDYVAIPFTAAQDYYIVGTMAYLNDTMVPNAEAGWCFFAHGQVTAPAFLAPVLAALGITWPTQVPAFEAKDILLWSDQNCFVRFAGSRRVQHLIPANTYVRFHRRCFIFFVQGPIPGTLRCWIEG